MYCYSFSSLVDMKRPKIPVPTPISLIHYLEDPDYEHEDFAHSSAITLRARVSGRITVPVCSSTVGGQCAASVKECRCRVLA